MAQARNHHRSTRILSAESGGTHEHSEYPTQTLFEHVKEKKVLCI